MQKVERVGETPESLRDLSVSLNKVAGTLQAQGDWSGAREHYGEGLLLGKALQAALPNISEYSDVAEHFKQRLKDLDKAEKIDRAHT